MEDKPIYPNKHIPRSERVRSNPEREIAAARKTWIYWWYMTLRASDEYRYCCENGGRGKLASIYTDFGDIPKLPFSMWYMKHGRKIFGESKPFKKVQSVETNRQLEELRLKQDGLILQIPLSVRKQTVMRQIGRFLKEAYEGRDIDIWKQSTARRQIVKSKIRMSTVETLLKVHELRNKHLAASLNEIGAMARIDPDILKRDTSGQDLDDSLVRRRMTIAVSRYLKQAKLLIANAERGIFPSIKPLSM